MADSKMPLTNGHCRAKGCHLRSQRTGKIPEGQLLKTEMMAGNYKFISISVRLEKISSIIASNQNLEETRAQ